MLNLVQKQLFLVQKGGIARNFFIDCVFWPKVSFYGVVGLLAQSIGEISLFFRHHIAENYCRTAGHHLTPLLLLWLGAGSGKEDATFWHLSREVFA